MSSSRHMPEFMAAAPARRYSIPSDIEHAKAATLDVIAAPAISSVDLPYLISRLQVVKAANLAAAGVIAHGSEPALIDSQRAGQEARGVNNGCIRYVRIDQADQAPAHTLYHARPDSVIGFARIAIVHSGRHMLDIGDAFALALKDEHELPASGIRVAATRTALESCPDLPTRVVAYHNSVDPQVSNHDAGFLKAIGFAEIQRPKATEMWGERVMLSVHHGPRPDTLIKNIDTQVGWTALGEALAPTRNAQINPDQST